MLVKIVALLRNGAGDAKVKIGALGLLGVLAKEEWVGRELRGMVGEFSVWVGTRRNVRVESRADLLVLASLSFFSELDGTSLFTHLGDLARNRAVGVQLAAVEVFVPHLPLFFSSTRSDLTPTSRFTRLATIYKSTRSRSSTSDDRIEDWLGMMEDLSRLLGERGEERIRASFIMGELTQLHTSDLELISF